MVRKPDSLLCLMENRRSDEALSGGEEVAGACLAGRQGLVQINRPQSFQTKVGTYSRCETIETYSPTVDPFPRVMAELVPATPQADEQRFSQIGPSSCAQGVPKPARTLRRLSRSSGPFGPTDQG